MTHATETTDILIIEERNLSCLIPQCEAQVCMRTVFRAGRLCRGGVNEQSACHAQMNQEKTLVIELNTKILTLPRQSHNLASYDFELAGILIDIGMQDLERLNAPIYQIALEALSNRLDFWQLWHLALQLSEQEARIEV